MLHFLLNCRVFEYLSIFLCLKIILVFGYLLTCRVVSACLTVMVKVIIQVTQYCRNEVVNIVYFDKTFLERNKSVFLRFYDVLNLINKNICKMSTSVDLSSIPPKTQY